MADLGIANDDLDAISKSLIINSKGETPAPKEEDDSDEEDREEVASSESQDDTASEEAPDGESDEEESDEEEGDTEQDIDEIEIEVVVDGETRSVPLKELKANYSGEKAIESRLQEVTETKTKVLNVGNALYNTLVEQSERLKKLDEVLAEQAKPPINWEELRVKDPGKYLLERDNAMRAEERRRQIEEENKRINEQKAQLEALQAQEYAAAQAKELTRRVPEITDPVKSKEIMEGIAEASKYYNFSQEELAAVVDHRQLMVLIDAAKYRKMINEKSGKTPNKKLELLKPRPLVKAGSKSNVMTTSKKAELSALKKAKSTGHVDDVAKLLMVKRKI